MKISPVRLLLGSLLVLAVAGCLAIDGHWIGRPVLSSLLAGMLGVAAVWEFRAMLGSTMPRRCGLMTMAASALFVAFPAAGIFFEKAHLHGAWLALLPLLPGAGILADRCTSTVAKEDLLAFGAAITALVVIAGPAAALVAILSIEGGVAWAAVLVAGSKLNDIGGYLVGTLFGRTKLAPGISPGKSREGAIAGLLLGTAGTVALNHLLQPFGAASPGLAAAVLLGIAIGAATQAGDLVESMMKRALGVKDSSRLLPAFGGVLDIMDSFIFSAPLGWAVAWSILS